MFLGLLIKNGGRAMSSKRIIMNYTVPPSIDDVEVMASEVIETLPEELLEFCEGVALVVEDFPDEALEQELELDDPYDLMALYRSGREISPGVERKTANDDDVLLLFRRPILDMWCESGDDINGVIRQVLIEELGKNFDFSDDEIEEMAERHYQGML
jgi:predicted Zn-dependent protease with MMP-like domain